MHKKINEPNEYSETVMLSTKKNVVSIGSRHKVMQIEKSSFSASNWFIY